MHALAVIALVLLIYMTSNILPTLLIKHLSAYLRKHLDTNTMSRAVSNYNFVRLDDWISDRIGEQIIAGCDSVRIKMPFSLWIYNAPVRYGCDIAWQ